MKNDNEKQRYLKKVLPARPFSSKNAKSGKWTQDVDEKVFGSYNLLTEELQQADPNSSGLVPKEHLTKGMLLLLFNALVKIYLQF